MLGIALASVSQAAPPIRIGLGMALTGGLAANGKAALLAMEIWRDEVDRKGGLLGRQVELVYYDDQTKPAAVPGIYSKLLDVDNVDFVVSGYGTDLIAPAMPIVIERQRVFMGLLGWPITRSLTTPTIFRLCRPGRPQAPEFSRAFLELAAQQNPKLRTVALVGADAEYPHNALAGARENLKQLGFEVVYDRTYPPTTDAGFHAHCAGHRGRQP